MTYTLTDVFNNLLTAIQDILGEVAATIADNASTIASIVVLGGLMTGVMYFGGRALGGITRWVRGLF